MSIESLYRRGGCTVAAFAVLLLAFPACDSTTAGLEAEFFVGTWNLESVRDGTGDRTDDVFALVEEMRVTFTAAGSFDLLVRYTEQADHPDRTIAGTYAVSQAGQLVLTADGTALSFQAGAVGENRVELRAPAVLVESVIAGTELDIGLEGTVTLTLARV